MNRTIAILTWFVLMTALAQAQEHICYVRSSDDDLKTKTRSSFSLLGEFAISFKDGTVTKSFRHDESNVKVNVGVQYPDDSIGNELAGLILAIAFSGKPENIFDEPGRVEGQAVGRDPMKMSLIISKSISRKRHVWTFHLSCVPKGADSVIPNLRG